MSRREHLSDVEPAKPSWPYVLHSDIGIAAINAGAAEVGLLAGAPTSLP